MIDIDHIRSFLEVAKTGNMSLAAKNLFVTQPALSQRISALEAQVGQSLFVRSRGGMQLNRFGEDLLSVCSALARDLEVLNDWVKAQKGVVSGHVRIATVSSFIGYVFPNFLKSFFVDYPDVKVTINVMTSRFIEEAVADGSHDMGIIVGACKKQSLLTSKLMGNRVFMVCNKTHPLAKKKRVTDADLRSARLIWHSEKRSRTVMQIAKKLGFRSMEEGGDIFLSDMESCKIYALNGLGVAFVSENHMQRELKNGDLVKLTNFVLDKPAYLVTRKDPYQSAVNTTFQKALIAFCRKWR